MTQAAIKTIKEIKEFYLEKTLFVALVFGVIFSTFAYMYFVNRSVFNIVERKNVEQKISDVGMSVTSLEFELISKKNSLSMDTVKEKGFEIPASTSFVVRKSLGKGLSMLSGL